MHHDSDTIIALSTPQGSGAIGVIRLSGPKAINIVDTFFFGKNLLQATPNAVYYGKIKHEDGSILDECLVTLFKGPRSYTKEDVIEISCHGSSFILEQVMQLLIRNGARPAKPGEFTMRAFLNGQLDLSQAEAVGDLIAAKSKSQHELAMHQMRGGFSRQIDELRAKLIKFASLIELENDFGEEDLEFANRDHLGELVNGILVVIDELLRSFSYGNAIKDGVPVAIVGKPNVGKSTLLNALLNEDKAIVSPIAGTTRDVIEDTINIQGILFRFIDTAGIRSSDDLVEKIGIERTMSQLEKAKIVLFVDEFSEKFNTTVDTFKQLPVADNQQAIILLNKVDQYDHSCHSYDVEESVSTLTNRTKTINISASKGKNIDLLLNSLVDLVNSEKVSTQELVVSNIRHYNALEQTKEALGKVKEGLVELIPSDLIALDIRHALHHLGEIAGTVSTDDLLDSIFRDFCIGK